MFLICVDIYEECCVIRVYFIPRVAVLQMETQTPRNLCVTMALLISTLGVMNAQQQTRSCDRDSRPHPTWVKLFRVSENRASLLHICFSNSLNASAKSSPKWKRDERLIFHVLVEEPFCLDTRFKVSLCYKLSVSMDTPLLPCSVTTTSYNTEVEIFLGVIKRTFYRPKHQFKNHRVQRYVCLIYACPGWVWDSSQMTHTLL